MRERMGRFIALLIGLGMICLFAVVYNTANRVNPETLALSVGIGIGAVLVGIPLALGAWIAVTLLRRQRPQVQQTAPTPSYMMPPMIIQMPPSGPQMPALPGYENWSTSAQPAAPRSWTTIGGDGDAH